MLTPYLAMWAPGPMELVIILIIGLLLFGKRLPEIARNLGKGVVEFKKGLKNIEDDMDHADQYQPPPPPKKALYNEDKPQQQSEVPAKGSEATD